MSKRDWLHRFVARGFLITLVALSCPVLSQSEPKTEQPVTGQQAPQTPSVLDGGSLRAIFDEAVKLYAAEKAENAASENRKERREESDLSAQWRQSEWAGWAAFFAGLAFVLNAATIGLVYATFRQTKRTADAAFDTAKAAKDSVAESIRSANAAEAAVAVARETATQELRAYITVKTVELLPFKIGRPLEARIVLTNAGQTPAQKAFLNATFLAIPLPRTVGVNVPPQPPNSRASVGPGVEMDLTVPVVEEALRLPAPYSDEIRRAIMQNKLGLLLIGFVIYEDVFGRRCTTPFKYQTISGEASRGNFILVASADGNEAT